MHIIDNFFFVKFFFSLLNNNNKKTIPLFTEFFNYDQNHAHLL